MPAILVASKMKSELPKPVHSALPIPQHPAKTGTLPAGKAKAPLGSQNPHRTLQRNQSLGSAAQVKRSPAAKGSTTDPQVLQRPQGAEGVVEVLQRPQGAKVGVGVGSGCVCEERAESPSAVALSPLQVLQRPQGAEGAVEVGVGGGVGLQQQQGPQHVAGRMKDGSSALSLGCGGRWFFCRAVVWSWSTAPHAGPEDPSTHSCSCFGLCFETAPSATTSLTTGLSKNCPQQQAAHDYYCKHTPARPPARPHRRSTAPPPTSPLPLGLGPGLGLRLGLRWGLGLETGLRWGQGQGLGLGQGLGPGPRLGPGPGLGLELWVQRAFGLLRQEALRNTRICQGVKATTPWSQWPEFERASEEERRWQLLEKQVLFTLYQSDIIFVFSLLQWAHIYTDWANHYLAKTGQQRLIKDLQQDVADGVLLAELIQVVANEKIEDINGYPQSGSQMIENIEACLGFLAAKGVNIKGLCAEEIRNGNLKAILGLFFSLSRYKQQQSQALKATSDTQRPNSPAQRPLPHTGQPLHGSLCPLHGLQRPTSPALKAQTDMTSRLPGPAVRAAEGKLRGGSGVGSRRSQSFNHYDKAKPSLSVTTISTSNSQDKEAIDTPSSAMADPGPLSTSSAQSSGGGSGGGSSGKPWRSKSLNAKHSSTSPMLSVKQPGSGALEVPPKVIAQKSMLEKLKLFNSKGKASPGSGSGEGPRQGAPEVGALEADSRPGTPSTVVGQQDQEGGQRPGSRSADASPKLALKGIAQRTLGRALAPKKSALKKDAERDKDKARPKEREWAREGSMGRASTPTDQHPRELKPESATSTPELKKNASLHKGNKGTKKDSASLARSGIPKPGGKGPGAGRGSVVPPGGKDGERGHGAKPAAGLSVHKGQPDSKDSCSSLALSECRASQTVNAGSYGGPLVVNMGTGQQSMPGNAVNVDLPHQQCSHPNMATVAPFMYRSQTDIDSILAETEGFPETLVVSKSLHTSLEYLSGWFMVARRKGLLL
ncbi:hypothetical protein ACEWY4_011248 [Coilia grayii]|uniref:Calponin-homology (CH) domain-containing protein n=1 Tax=Coilia grayii TaxID=363190 RepID=A0ABD1K487_9TELE